MSALPLLPKLGRASAIAAPEAGAFPALVIHDPATAAVAELAQRAAQRLCTVLILGETGVGKDVLARQIHAMSPRAGKPFVRVDCGALSESLVESELFGSRRGAFTGAAEDRAGLIEAAQHGTVFLDEIGELPLRAQAKLLRLLDARELLRVGEVRYRSVDVRFLAATNRDLAAEVERGTFRRDLYYRLNVLTLVIPPLRDRPLDIAPLARQLLAEIAGAQGSAPPVLTSEALACLQGQAWPGNVRELRNVLERAVLMCRDGAIGPEQIAPPPRTLPRAALQVGDTDRAPPWDMACRQSRNEIEAALAMCAGNQSRAAKLLGISRNTLLARLDKLRIVRPRKPRG